MPSGSSCSRTRLISVVFPAPDGPDTMNNVPSGWKLLDILHLLAYPLDLRFQFYNGGSERRGARLRAHRIDLAQHLLRKKIELLAGGLLSFDCFRRLLDVMREPRQLLGDVTLLDHHHDFLRDAVVIHVDSCLRGDLLHALLIRLQQFVAHTFALLS